MTLALLPLAALLCTNAAAALLVLALYESGRGEPSAALSLLRDAPP